MPVDLDETLLDRVEGLCSRRWKRALFGILVVAAVFRFWCYAEMRDAPAFVWHLHSEMDTKFFSDVAGEIRKDWRMADKPMHPDHYWHRLVAREHFRKHPEQLTGTLRNKPPEQIEVEEIRPYSQRLWNEWYGGKRYHQEPLFFYLAALFYSERAGPFGLDMGPVPGMFLFQMLTGILTIGLLFDLLRRTMGALVATVAAALVTFWGPMVHYEMVLMRTSLIVFFGVFLLWICERFVAERGRPWWHYLFLGLVFGLATALKTTFLVFAGGLLAAIVRRQFHEPLKLLRSGSMIGIGVLLALLPWMYRNSTVGVSPLALTSVGPITVAGTNVPEFDPWDGWYPFEGSYPATLAEIMDEHHESLAGSLLAAIERHTSLFDWIGLLFAKLGTVFHAFEMPNNSNFYLSGLYSNAMYVSQYLVTFGWVLPFAIVGLWFSRRQRGVRSWWWFFFCTLGPMVLFYSLSRFRAPLVVGMIPFAAYGLIEMTRALLRRKWTTLGLCGVVVAGLLVFMHRDIPRRPLIGEDYQNIWTLYYGGPLQRAQAARDARAAAALYDRHIATFPDYAFRYGLDHPIDNEVDGRFASVLQGTLREAAAVHRFLGNRSKAQEYLGVAERLTAALDAYLPRRPKQK